MSLRALIPRPRPLAWPARLLLVIVLGLVTGQLLTASFLPFESRLPHSLADHTARVYAIMFGGSVILLALSWRWPRVISAVYIVFLAGLLLLTLGKNLRELARDANPLGTEYALIHRTEDDSMRALLDASNMHGSTTYLIFYNHYRGNTLIAPEPLLDGLGLRQGRLVWWGGLENVRVRDYDPVLGADEAAALRAQPYTRRTAYDGRNFLLFSGPGDIWLGQVDDTIYIIPTGLLPAPEAGS